MQPIFWILAASLYGLASGLGGYKALALPSVKINGPRKACPCPQPSQCEPIKTVAKREGFVFATSHLNYEKYDWTKITTVIAFSAAMNDSLMCYAHSKGARISYGADFPLANLTRPADRHAWVTTQVKFAQDHYMDGINFDFENPIAASDTKRREALNSLVQELTAAFKTAIPHAQVTFDVPSSPISDRNYDYKFIAKTMDFILIMAYDENGYCKTGANSGYTVTAAGINNFLKLGIPGSKMVLGLPWYGYDYPCGKIDKNNNCTVSPHCGGRQMGYDGVYRLSYQNHTSGILWDKKSSTPFFSYKDGSRKPRQAWCDNAESLTLKYKLAASKNLLGVGLWHADTLLYDDSTEGKKQRSEMWGALPKVN